MSNSYQSVTKPTLANTIPVSKECFLFTLKHQPFDHYHLGVWLPTCVGIKSLAVCETLEMPIKNINKLQRIVDMDTVKKTPFLEEVTRWMMMDVVSEETKPHSRNERCLKQIGSIVWYTMFKVVSDDLGVSLCTFFIYRFDISGMESLSSLE